MVFLKGKEMISIIDTISVIYLTVFLTFLSLCVETAINKGEVTLLCFINLFILCFLWPITIPFIIITRKI